MLVVTQSQQPVVKEEAASPEEEVKQPIEENIQENEGRAAAVQRRPRMQHRVKQEEQEAHGLIRATQVPVFTQTQHASANSHLLVNQIPASLSGSFYGVNQPKGAAQPVKQQASQEEEPG